MKTMKELPNWEVGKRYILKRRFATTLLEIEVIEISQKAIKVIWDDQGRAEWIDKFYVSGDSYADYELYEELK